MVKLTLLVVTVLASLPLMAQTDTTPSQGTERNEPAPAVSAPVLGSSSEPEPEEIPIEEHLVPLPSIVGGFAPTLSYSSKSERSNLLSGGITLGANYDDNAFISSGSKIDNWSYSVFPNIALQKTTTRTRLRFFYGAGLTVNQELTSQNQGSHDLNLSLLYRLSPHVNLILDDHFSKTSGIFSQYDSTAAPQNGPSAGGAYNLALPLSNQLSNSSNAQLGYQFSAADAVGISGGFNFTDFSDAPAGTFLLDNRSAQAAAFYAHRVTPRNWMGISYRFQRLTFTEGTGETLTHAFLLFHTFTLPARMSISFFGGPEYTDSIPPIIVGVPVASGLTQWAASGGASFSVTGPQTAFLASFSRRTTDGGGYQGSVQSTSFDAGVRRRLGRFWTVSAGGGYSQNDSLTVVPGIPPSLNSGFLNCGLERKIGESLKLSAGYSHELVKGQDVSAPDDFQHRNRVILSLSYGFSRPIGR